MPGLVFSVVTMPTYPSAPDRLFNCRSMFIAKFMGVSPSGPCTLPLRRAPTPPLRRAAVVAVFFVAIGIIFLSYTPGLTGTFLFDDHPNLHGLDQLRTFSDVIHWVFAGTSGPTGRPMSLATFLLEQHHWPTAAQPFLRTNILLHLVNTLLVALLFLRLNALSRPPSTAAMAAMLGASLLWAALPILVTTNLVVVQRMTSLSATFLLAGLYFYLIGRTALKSSPILAYALMSSAILIFTPLSVLAKENGLLLPLFILVTEFTILRKTQAEQPPPNPIFLVILAFICIALIALILSHISIEATYAERDFTPLQRFSSQALFLWDYLRLSFFPIPGSIHVFHDNHSTFFASPGFWTLTGVAILFWILAIYFSLLHRKQAPWLAFGLFWFLTGHLLESTVFGLEPYFLHRNYVPLIGPCYALGSAMLQIQRPKVRRVAGISATVYLFTLAIVLFQTTSLWGSPTVGATIWHITQPSSLRATQHLADLHARAGSINPAYEIIRNARHLHPTNAALALQELYLICRMPRHETALANTWSVEKLAHTGVVTAEFAPTLGLLLTAITRESCAVQLDKEWIRETALAALSNKRTMGGNTTSARLFLVLARVEALDGNLNNAMDWIEASLDHKPDIHVVTYGANLLQSAALFDEAQAFVRDQSDRTSYPNMLSAILRVSRWPNLVEELEETLRVGQSELRDL
jgi:protein O-mannosyl-transferase